MDPVIQSDNGSLFTGYEFRTVLKENHLRQKLIRPHTPEQDGIEERANETMRETLLGGSIALCASRDTESASMM